MIQIDQLYLFIFYHIGNPAAELQISTFESPQFIIPSFFLHFNH